jgi:hypothetical protein
MTARQPSPGFVSGRDDLSAGGTTTAEFLLGISDFEEGLAVCAELFLGTGFVNESFALSDNKFAIPYTKATQTLVGQRNHGLWDRRPVGDLWKPCELDQGRMGMAAGRLWPSLARRHLV